MASAMPPLAVPSSLVRTMPSTCTASRKSMAWRSPFWPVVASMVSRVSCGAPGSRLSITLRTLRSSSIRCCWVCRRPAVSMITTSAPRALAASMASKATAPGSEPASPRTRSPSARRAHSSSCSAAAARKVSPAASSTVLPSSWRRCQAILPMVVVLPLPLTPTMRITVGSWVRSMVSSSKRAVSASSSRRRRVRSSPLCSSPEPASPSSRSTIAAGGGRADVGVDQRLLQVLEGLVVERLEHRGLQLGPERLPRLGHVLPQAAEEAAALLGLLARLGRLRRGFAGEKELVPAARHARGGYAASMLLLLLQLARDHPRDAVAAHAHPVEAVGGVHRALLVGDHDELGAVAVAADELEEAVDVEVVQRGLDLVQDVERARPGQEDGEHEGQGDEGLLAAGEQREPLHRLAGRGHLDLDARLCGDFLRRLTRAPRLPRAPPPRPAPAAGRRGAPAAAGRGRPGTGAGPRPRSCARSPRRSPRSSCGCGGRSP